jgi:hypothetical protein
VGIMAVIFAVRPWIMVPTLVLAVVFLVLRRFYMRSARDIKVYYHALIKRKQYFPHINKEIQKGAVAKSYMTKGLLIYD